MVCFFGFVFLFSNLLTSMFTWQQTMTTPPHDTSPPPHITTTTTVTAALYDNDGDVARWQAANVHVTTTTALHVDDMAGVHVTTTTASAHYTMTMVTWQVILLRDDLLRDGMFFSLHSISIYM